MNHPHAYRPPKRAGRAVPAWADALRGRGGLVVLHDAAVSAPWGIEWLPWVVVHRRGFVVIESRSAAAIACLGKHDRAESPCLPVLEAHRRTALLRWHIKHRARRLFPDRLFPGRFVAGLHFQPLVVVERCAGAIDTDDGHPSCAAALATPDAVARHLDLFAHPPGRCRAVLWPLDMEALAADLEAVAASATDDPDDVPCRSDTWAESAWPLPGCDRRRTEGATRRRHFALRSTACHPRNG